MMAGKIGLRNLCEHNLLHSSQIIDVYDPAIKS